MFGFGLGPDIQKIITPLRYHSSKSDDQGIQTILVTSTLAKVQALKFSYCWLLFLYCFAYVVQNDRFWVKGYHPFWSVWSTIMQDRLLRCC